MSGVGGLRTGTWALMVLSSVACSTAKEWVTEDGTVRVNPARLEGLPESELVEVKARRADLSRAREAENEARKDRAQVRGRVDEAKGQLDIARAEHDSAEEKARVGRGELEAGEEKRAGQEELWDDEELGMSDLAATELKQEAAQARLEYLEALSGYAENRVEVAEKVVRLEVARVDQASFDVLKRTRPSEARRVDTSSADMATRVSDRQHELIDARATMQKHLDRARLRHQTWTSLNQQLRPVDRSGPLPEPETLKPM